MTPVIPEPVNSVDDELLAEFRRVSESKIKGTEEEKEKMNVFQARLTNLAFQWNPSKVVKYLLTKIDSITQSGRRFRKSQK